MACFSYTVFLGMRYATRFPPTFGTGSLLNDYTGDAINHLTIRTSGPPRNPYNEQMLLIITADREVEARVQAAARKAGFPSSTFNTLVIPSAVAHLGSDAQADTFYLVHRNALPDDDQAQQDYLATDQPVLRVTLQDPDWQADPLPVPRLQVHGTGESELDLVPAVDALGEAIRAQYGDSTGNEVRVQVLPLQGFAGLQAELNGGAPGSDALYLWTDVTFQLPEPDSFAMIYGANHAATGKATYSSLALYENSLKVGLEAVDNSRFDDSAQDYLPPHTPNVDKLYAWKVAWDCEGEAHCLELVDPGCDALDLTFDSPFTVACRLYLEPATKTGPDFREIAYDRVMVFTP